MARRATRGLSPLLAAIFLGTSPLISALPQICGKAVSASAPRAPPALLEYLQSVGEGRFNQRAACARWAGTFSQRHRSATLSTDGAKPTPARLILFAAKGVSQHELVKWLRTSRDIRRIELARHFVIAEFERKTASETLLGLLQAPQLSYVEPDCNGPDFLTTSMATEPMPIGALRCWQQDARSSFPNDPCMDELWGHTKIGWDSRVAARSLPRVVAVLDSGIDASHEDLSRNVLRLPNREPERSEGHAINARCATSGRCYPHGTEMAGTIGGRMDNGIGVAGVAPNSRLLPIVISQVDRGMLGRLSTIASGIDAAVLDGAEVINISAKWPVDSRAISESILAAVGGAQQKRRLIVTGYATSLDVDDTVREYFPSQYRCLPGVVAAVPADMRDRDLFNPPSRPNANDGRIQAPGVDIVVTTTENSERGYALSGAAGASSAAAYVSGAVALIWGSPPLNKCDAQQIKQLLFCRSKSSNSTRYPWVHVDFLRELSNIEPAADCRTAMERLGCG